jgi:hypothetical protein
MIYFKPGIQVTDETAIDANDGTIAVKAISDYGVYYQLTRAGLFDQVSYTGLFKNLTPGTYDLAAYNLNNEGVYTTVTIVKATEFTTHYKYKLEFESERGDAQYLIKISDMKRQYPISEYPKELIPGEEPAVFSTKLQNEDKAEVFAPTALTFNFIADGTFTVDQFATADERTYFVEYFENDSLLFRGWLLPDQVDDSYDDPGYEVSLVATDGLLSLKAADFGNDTDIRLFGIQAWLTMVRYCLEKLDYSIGNIIIVKSLQYDGEMDYNQVGNWADLFYDEDGMPLTVYNGLEKLLREFKVVLFQDKGEFKLIDFNAVSHKILAHNEVAYNKAFYEYGLYNELVLQGAEVEQPGVLKIGVCEDLVPIKKIPPLTYDDSFKQLIAKLDFNLLSLLFDNPSFEIGSVEGELPIGFKPSTDGGTVVAGVTKTDAFIGDWSFKVHGNGSNLGYFDLDTPFIIDQPNKSLQISFNWKPTANPSSGITEFGLVFAVLAYFVRDDGAMFYLQQSPYRGLDTLNSDDNDYEQSSEVVWQQIVQPHEFHSEGEVVSIKGSPTRDYVGWQSFSLNSPPIPGTGTMQFRIYNTKGVFFDDSFQPDRLQGKTYVSIGYNINEFVLYDNLSLTLNDFENSYNKQVGERHIVTNLTNFAKSEKKTVEIPVTNYPNNKRIASNVFYGLDYTTAKVGYLWKDPFQTTQLTGPVEPGTDIETTGYLGQVIINQLARSYQRPMYKLEPTVASGSLSFYTLFEVAGYEGKPFIPFSITHYPARSEAALVIVETDDTDFLSEYQYLAKYEKNAKKIVQ